MNEISTSELIDNLKTRIDMEDAATRTIIATLETRIKSPNHGSKPRAILIENCKACQHHYDWSSGGVVCEKANGRKIVAGYDSRKPVKETTPDWCPLPRVTGVEYP